MLSSPVRSPAARCPACRFEHLPWVAVINGYNLALNCWTLGTWSPRQRTQCSSPFKHMMEYFGILHRAAWVHNNVINMLAMCPHTEVEDAGMVPLFLISMLPEQPSWQTSHRGAPPYIDRIGFWTPHKWNYWLCSTVEIGRHI